MSEYVQLDIVVNDFMCRLMGAVEAQKEANEAMGKLYQAIEEQRRLNEIKDMLYMSMAGYQLVKEETLPSTQADDNAYVVKSFLAALKVEGRADSTLETYWGELKNLFLWINKNYRDITTNDIRAYLAHKKADDHNNDNTINNKINDFSSFFNWLQREEFIVKNPMSRIKISKTERKVSAVLTDAQIEIIRCGCKCKRDLAMVELLTATGMRVGELVALRRDSIDIQTKRCVVYGKGRKERPVYITGRTAVHIKEYLDQRTDDCPALFVSHKRKRNPVTGELECHSLTTGAVRDILKEIVKRDKRLKGLRVHPHMFRHYLATTMHQRGARGEDIRDALGHSSIDTTMKYIRTDENTVKETYSKFAV